MKRQQLITALIFFFIFKFSFCQQAAKVPYLVTTPEIDGILDPGLKKIKKNRFNHIWQFNNPLTDTVPVTYSFAYTRDHFYLYIETGTDSINFRDRGFQNGDGFKFLFAIPQKDSLTDEFYELFFSPSKDEKYWARQKIWSYNNKTVLRDFSKATRFRYACQSGKCGFEALIFWGDIPPYHPWSLNNIGFNLYFAKAIGDTITNGYAVVDDEGLWDEGVSRKFAQLSFEKPHSVKKTELIVKPKNATIYDNNNLDLDIVAISGRTYKEKVVVIILNEENKAVFKRTFYINLTSKLNQNSILLNVANLAPGVYTATLNRSMNTSKLEFEFTILPKIDYGRFHDNLSRNAGGAVSTLTFKLNQIQSQSFTLKPYESGKDLYLEINNFLKDYTVFDKGHDPYKTVTGPYRRAFRSEFDSTYQPYTIRLPKDYTPGRKYPLLVFLHGSGVDDQGLLNNSLTGGKFIEIAPFGRDKYNCFSSDSSQKDILEAIQDAIVNFSVDTSKIVIGGFSMGGYGALRTFYEYPNLFKGVSVFAGHPHLASNWLEGDHPNFLQQKYLLPFANVPTFVFHGSKDGSLPVDLIKQMYEALKKVGAKTVLYLDENKGHEYPDNEIMEKYHSWLDSINQELSDTTYGSELEAYKVMYD